MTVAPAATDRHARHALRLDVEAFLYDEAALLDAWRLDDWLALFTRDARYEVPSTDRPGGGRRCDTGGLAGGLPGAAFAACPRGDHDLGTVGHRPDGDPARPPA